MTMAMATITMIGITIRTVVLLLLLMVDGLTWSWFLREGSLAGVSGWGVGVFRAASGGGGAGEAFAVLRKTATRRYPASAV
jgi:hypothetical protein